MSNAKHTPGPWTLESVGSAFYVASDNGRPDAVNTDIAKVYRADTADEEALADATLIAAAPDLLAALRLALAQIEDLDACTDAEECSLQPDTMQAIWGAIAKAEGK